MATTMFPNFTSTDRRKKAVTYGKSSRPPTIPPPISSSNSDVPSSQRLRENNAASTGSLKRPGGLLKPSGGSGNAQARGDSPDMFEIPSEDEAIARVARPSQKPSTKKTLQTDPRISAKGKSDFALNVKPKKVKSTSSGVESAKPGVLITKTAQRTGRLTQPASESLPSSYDPIAAPIQQRRIHQPAQKDKRNENNQEMVQPPDTTLKAASRQTAITASRPPKSTNTRTISPLPSTKAFRARELKQSEDMDVYDLPSSDDEPPTLAREPPHQSVLSKGKKSNGTVLALIDASRKESAESDDSMTLKKRKRRGSISSSTTARSVTEHRQDPPAPQRSSKYQKKETSVSPGHGTLEQEAIAPVSSLPAINKPRRTRLRTVPVLVKPTMTKGQSAPATLNSMLPRRNVPKQSPVPEVPEVASVEDETMYEIPDSLTTPVRASKSVTVNSVTLHQKALFSSLLGDSSSSNTSMPKISTLQLTDQKPKSLLGALARSKSDLTHGAQNHKSRLIDKMKRDQTSSEDDDFSESESESESESGEESEEFSSSEPVKQQIGRDQVLVDVKLDDMEVEYEAKAVSQTSQPTSGFGTRSRLTYAKSRSYLQEANLEDALLISMDLDDALDSHRDGQTDDEDDPMSQVQARHELKRRGQQTAFQWETETLINDISDETSNSVRRSTMLELCTKMADETFTVQLLESSLAHQFFQNTLSNGEIIFDFSTAAAMIFVLETDPISTVLDEVQRTGIIATLVRLSTIETDIARIAKDRKTNLSKIAQESVVKFRALLQDGSFWTLERPEKMTPQIVALKALEMLSTCLRRAGSNAPLVGQDEVSKLVEISSGPSERLRSGKASLQDNIILDLLLSILESASIAKHKQPTWSTGTLQHLANLLPLFFQPDSTTSTMLAVKLCMNLTNNKPNACQPFSSTKFVQPLVSSIIHKFGQLESELKQEQRTEVLETLILSLGAMINLAELSDVARKSVDDGKQMIKTLVEIFVKGSERAAKAESMEESHSSVAVGYLTVLLGNLCLNSHIKSKVRGQLPDQRLNLLVEKIKEFLNFHERLDRKAKDFEESEDRDAWSNYTSRLKLVVDKLSEAKA